MEMSVDYSNQKQRHAAAYRRSQLRASWDALMKLLEEIQAKGKTIILRLKKAGILKRGEK